MTDYPLQESVTAVADSNGRAVATRGPQRFGDSWEVTLFGASTTSVKESQLIVYRGVESMTAKVASTYSANNDTAGGDPPIILPAGDKLVFVWASADPGSICTCRIEGTLKSRRM